MARWEAGSRQRLEAAAVELYAEQGFAATTVVQVAERAGVTERTFFRHFADKREVLFANEPALTEILAEAVRAAPAGSEAVRSGLVAIARELQPRHADLVRRGRIIAANQELRERELLKLASWTAALEDALVERGEPAEHAALAAAIGVAVLNVAARYWLAGDGGELVTFLDTALRDAAPGDRGRPPYPAPVRSGPG
ncbi:MAG: helix-turn-helix domain-containing protein [Actinoplanes sp.]